MSRIEITAADRAAVSALLDWRVRTGGDVELKLSDYVSLRLCWGPGASWLMYHGISLAEVVHSALVAFAEETRDPV